MPTSNPQNFNALLVFIASVLSTLFASIPNIIKLIKEYNTNKKKDTLFVATKNHDILIETMNQFHNFKFDGGQFQRVVLWNIHNGENIFEKVHLWKMRYHTDTTSVKTPVNMSDIYRDKINLTFYYDIIKYYKTGEYGGIKEMFYINDVDDMKDHGAKHLHKTIGDNTLVSILLRNAKGKEVGILNISSIHDKINLTKDDLYKLKELAIRVSSLI